MSLVLARVDERLIHGQVVVGWVPELGARRILVADDAAAADPFDRDMLESAAPPGITVEVLDTAAAGRRLREDVSEPTLLLVRSPASMLAVAHGGGVLAEVNLGGLYAKPGSRRFGDYLHFLPADLDALRELAKSGRRIVAQDLPGRAARDLTASLAEGHLVFDQLPAGDP